jgi:cell division protein FtsB
MRWLSALLFLVLLLMQYRIWFGPADAFDAIALHAEIDAQRLEIERLRERNAALGAEVRDLKQGKESIEERARSDLGMVKDDETFYQVVAPIDGGAAVAPGTVPASVPPTLAPAPAPATGKPR